MTRRVGTSTLLYLCFCLHNPPKTRKGQQGYPLPQGVHATPFIVRGTAKTRRTGGNQAPLLPASPGPPTPRLDASPPQGEAWTSAPADRTPFAPCHTRALPTQRTPYPRRAQAQTTSAHSEPLSRRAIPRSCTVRASGTTTHAPCHTHAPCVDRRLRTPHTALAPCVGVPKLCAYPII